MNACNGCVSGCECLYVLVYGCVDVSGLCNGCVYRGNYMM